MTDTLKSVLFVDFDSLHLALRARDPALARRFAAHPAALLDAVETGTLIGSGSLGAARRRILMRRCYADPRTLGRARDSFVTQGFQMVDCPMLPGHERNSAEVQITLDTIDALGHPTAFDEFILLAADSDFTPLIYRLRAHNRAASIFASGATAGGYRAIADGIIEEGALASLLAGLDEPAAEEDEEEEGTRPLPEREDLAALARRIHNATQVPLFPPRVYGELFRALVDEIAERGYHFNATAENVAARLIDAGRKASRRQVAFVVKGLALKGHVLSERDTPERLAEVFREQVLYLARHAGIEVDPRVERQVGNWIAACIVIAEPAEPPVVAPETAVVATPPAATAVVVEAPVVETGPAEAEAVIEAPTAEAAVAEPDAAEPAVTPMAAAEPVEEPAVPIEEPAVPTVIEAEPVEAEAEEPAAAAPLVEDLAALADSPDPAEEAEEEPEAPDVAPEPAPVRAAPVVRPPVPRGPAQRNGARPAETPLDPFESSLLAAIAEAVQAVDPAKAVAVPPVAPAEADMRIEPRLDPPGEGKSAPEVKAVPAKSAAEAAAEADIGDEIQRILAAYSESRKPGAG